REVEAPEHGGHEQHHCENQLSLAHPSVPRRAFGWHAHGSCRQADKRGVHSGAVTPLRDDDVEDGEIGGFLNSGTGHQELSARGGGRSAVELRIPHLDGMEGNDRRGAGRTARGAYARHSSHAGVDRTRVCRLGVCRSDVQSGGADGENGEQGVRFHDGPPMRGTWWSNTSVAKHVERGNQGERGTGNRLCIYRLMAWVRAAGDASADVDGTGGDFVASASSAL